MTEMVGGAFVGAIASELLKSVIEEAKKVLAFRSVSKDLASTMEDVQRTVIHIEMLQGDPQELKKLNDIIDEALVLVRKCSQVKRWKLHLKAKYTREINEINKKMLRFCQVELSLILLRNQMVMMYRQGQIIVPHSRSSRPSKRLHVDTEAIKNHLQIIKKKLDVLSVSPTVYRDLCSVPKVDKVLFGLDLPLMELKKKLLDDDPVVSLVVSAPPGCGKTTLVTQLCHDDEIKEKFEHIFFSVVSSAPNFRTIVRNLLQHNGYEALAFENDSQAVDGLTNLVEELKEDGPILLVLDDVRHGAESLLQKFQINIPNFKILVTSRFEFPSFGPTYHLNPLGNQDARSILIQWTDQPYHLSPDKYEDHLEKVLKHCYGFPLLIEVIGVQLFRKALKLGQVESWYEEETTLDNHHPSVLKCMQHRFNALESYLKECFLDMGAFLEDQKIRVSVIIDIWVELYSKGSKCKSAYVKCLNDLAFYNLLKLVQPGRKGFSVCFTMYKGYTYPTSLFQIIRFSHEKNDDFLEDQDGFNEDNYKDSYEDGFYNEILVTQHSILRELAICQSKSEEHQERKRLNLEIREDKFPDWCSDLKKPISARLLSISTDDFFSSTWVEMDCPNVEVLVLNLSSSNYALPNFISTMKKLKVVIIINHGLGFANLTNLVCLSSLPNLKRIRFEKISITSLDILQSQLGSLEKLSLFMCSFGEVFYNIEDINVSEALPSLQEIDIDYCYDLDELPYWVSEVVSLKTLSITNWSKLTKLPETIGNLSKLEVLRLNSCINLCELPETIERLGGLRFLDLSVCLALRKLPLEIGKLQKLEKISMEMCKGCELPDTMRNIKNLKVIM